MKNKNTFCLAGIFCVLGTAAVHAASISFDPGNTWSISENGGPATTTNGFVRSATGVGSTFVGTTTQGGVTFTFTSSFNGTATGSGGGLTTGLNLGVSTANPQGLIFGTDVDSNSGLTFTGSSFSGAVTNYQRWDFSFSSPVVISSLLFQDIDNNGNAGSFRDMLAAEGFSASAPGAAGTGDVAASYTLQAVTSLITGTADIGAGTLNAVSSPLGLANPSSTPDVEAGLSFGSTPISSFSVYSFSDRAVNHRLSLRDTSGGGATGAAAFSFDVVPEPSSTMLSGMAVMAGLMLRRRKSN